MSKFCVIVAGEQIAYETLELHCELLPDGEENGAAKFKPGRKFTLLDAFADGYHLILGAPKRTNADDGTVTLEYASWEQA